MTAYEHKSRVSQRFQRVCGPHQAGHGPRGRFVKAKFTPEEDERLLNIVSHLETINWATVSSVMTTRNARQCRERYNNYLCPRLRREEWTEEEDRLLLEKYTEIGPKWNRISKFFEGRSDIALRNRHMSLSRRLKFTDGIYKPPQSTSEAAAPDVVDIPRDASNSSGLGSFEWDFWNERVDLDDQASLDSWTAFGSF
jgi:hypothetical protein